MVVPTAFQYKKIKLTSRGPGKKIFYKYCLLQDVCVDTKIIPDTPLTVTDPINLSTYTNLSTGGLLKINKGYSWDGATGIPDTEANMFAALVHDALYQLMREYNCKAPGTTTIGGIYRKVFRLEADILFRTHYTNNGGCRWWIAIIFCILRKCGKCYTLCGRGSNKKKWKQLEPGKKAAPALGLTSCPDSDEPTSSS